jgi:hypothetical protein
MPFRSTDSGYPVCFFFQDQNVDQPCMHWFCNRGFTYWGTGGGQAIHFSWDNPAAEVLYD